MKSAIRTKQFLGLFIIFLLLSCNSARNSANKIKKHLFRIEKQIIKDDNGVENFGSFLEFFIKDTSFQIERTFTPYITSVELVTINEAGDLKAIINTSINSTDWEPSSWLSKEPQRIEVKNDSAIVTYCDTFLYRQILTNHIYIRSAGKWHFKTLDIDD